MILLSGLQRINQQSRRHGEFFWIKNFLAELTCKYTESIPFYFLVTAFQKIIFFQDLIKFFLVIR